MAKTYTIRSIEKCKGSSKQRIIFNQRSAKPYETSSQNAKRFHVGDEVTFHGQKLCKC